MEVSIIIVNYNGRKVLEICLQSILKIKTRNYEIIVVDNASTDNTSSIIQKKYPQVKIITLTDNFGPSYARNQGAKIASGRYLAFLDNDTKVDKNWLIAANSLFTKNPKIGCLQSKLLLINHPKHFDYAGDYLNQFGLLSHRATYGDFDHGQHDKEVPIFAAKSAGMFIRKKVFDQIGGFDPNYFIYMEETDLCWRAWLSGYQTFFCPKSIVYHGFSGSFKLLNKNFATYNLRFHGTKNYILSLIKNLETTNLLKILPKQITIYFFFSLYLFITGKFNESFLIIKGILWNLSSLKSTKLKRKHIQQQRVCSDKDIFPYFFVHENLVNKIKKSIFLKPSFNEK